MRESEKFPMDAGMALRSSWNLVKHTLDNFWRQWLIEYLRPIEVGDLQIVADENVRDRWIRGRVIRTIPGKDRVVRQAEVRTMGGILERPARLCRTL